MIRLFKATQLAIAASIFLAFGGMSSIAQTPPSAPPDAPHPMQMTPEERERHHQEMMERMQGDIDAMRQMMADLEGMSQMTPEEMAQHHQQMREQMQGILSHLEEMQQMMERHHEMGHGSGMIDDSPFHEDGSPGDRMPMPSR
ncbi:MAG TPA: hypothetical protein IGS17_01840 [Oscillatoriales cyanobacterium M59_W2019_021]|nr:MAG: hypothetical protein D6728_06880 [Cyanobacteria bacterium J055]HIK32884.1 hypothetical protein [Oscillatoriales cyanobacterium M4454_W2019_049]HIK49656.1 hypothetical protein [Oscillatoriales cyanobacterium M59_W2019_021]